MSYIGISIIPILILVSSIIGGIVVLIVFAARKKKINKKLQEDNINILNGKEPSGAGRHESSALTILSLSLSILVLVLSLILYINIRMNNLRNDISNDINYSNARIEMLSDEIEDLHLELKKERSLLSSFAVYTLADSLNNETMTVDFKIVIMPKEVSNDTIVSITIDDITYTATKDNDNYQVIYTKNIFNELDSEKDIIVKITSNGVTKTEIIDSSLYNTLYSLTSPNWGSIFPTISDCEYYTNYNIVPEIKKNKYEINHKMDIRINKQESSVTSFKVKFYDRYKLLTEQDLTSRLVDKGDYYELTGVHINETFSNIESDYVDMVWEIIDANGFTICTHDRTFKSGLYNYYLPYYTITSPDEKTYNFK